MSAGMGAISGKGSRDTIGLGKVVVGVLVVIVGVQGSTGLGCGEFVGLTTSRLFLGLLSPICGNSLKYLCNRMV